MKAISEAVEVCTLKGQLVGLYNSVQNAVKILKLPGNRNITACFCGLRNKAYGYRWRKVYIPFLSLPNELWKDVVGFEGLYKVSNFGRVVSIQYHGKPNWRLLSQNDMNGYKSVKLRDWKHGITKTPKVHILVAQAFIPNVENKPFIDHKDGNKYHNYVENLHWVTHDENVHNPNTLYKQVEHITAYNKSEKSKTDRSKTFSKPIIEYDVEGNFIREYPSITFAAKELKIHNDGISRVCRGISRCYYGHYFKFKELKAKNNENT